MKKVIWTAAALLALTGAAQAQYYGYGSNSNSHQRQGYVTQQGTYVAPSRATNPNSTQYDNYGTRGNVNPYTGQVGTRNPRY